MEAMLLVVSCSSSSIFTQLSVGKYKCHHGVEKKKIIENNAKNGNIVSIYGKM